MTLLPLAIPVALAISFYEVPVKTVDVIYAKVNGIDTGSISGSRTVNVAADTTGGKRLEHIFGGSISAGDVGLITTGQFHMLDAFKAGEVRKQSYINWRGQRYRIVAVDDWSLQAGARIYLASRHVNFVAAGLDTALGI